jgi:hypothetical protein
MFAPPSRGSRSAPAARPGGPGKEPSQRYPSVREMADDLRRFLASEVILAEPAAYARSITGNSGAPIRHALLRR